MQEALKKENTKLLEIELEKKKEERPTGTVFGNNNAEVTYIRDLEKWRCQKTAGGWHKCASAVKMKKGGENGKTRMLVDSTRKARTR